MKKHSPAFVIGHNIITSLGFTSETNWSNLCRGTVGIKQVDQPAKFKTRFFASMIDYDSNDKFTKLEKLLITSIKDSIKNLPINLNNKETLVIVSTTKGNIDYINQPKSEQVLLWSISNKIKNYFRCANTPVIVSNACISGTLGVLIGFRLLQTGKYKTIIVTAGDILTDFVISGFHALKALSPGCCRPFDKNRDGLNPGEGAASLVLTTDKSLITQKVNVMVVAGSSSNDANHITGPSRTGQELFMTIKNACSGIGSGTDKIDSIMAHGIGTLYSDEMESKAIDLAGLNDVPVTGIKGYIGHAFGAAGLIESVVAVKSLQENTILKTQGFQELGVPCRLNITTETIKRKISNCLKISSGFGGTNAAVLFSKVS
jgi:3-oxoacyl-[acyl-carrier-protein] synthase-1